MAIKKAKLPNWYILLYSLVCIIDGLIGIVTLGWYTSNLQLIVALWYAEMTLNRKLKNPKIFKGKPIMFTEQYDN